MKIFSTIIKIIVFFAIWIAGVYGLKYLLVEIPEVVRELTFFDKLGFPCLVLIFTILLTILFCNLASKEKIKIHIFTKFVRDVGLSLLIGSILVCGIVGMYFLLDAISISGGTSFGYWYLWVLLIVVNILIQEILLRGYIFSLLETKFGVVCAVSITSLLFLPLNGVALASGAIPILFAVFVNALWGLLRYYTGSIGAPIVAHLIWGLAGGLLLGGVHIVNGQPSYWDVTLIGVDLFSDSNMGFSQGSVSIVVAIVLIDLLLILIKDKNGNKRRKA
jgi:membrane protease YdiL (CAAX protease family)